MSEYELGSMLVLLRTWVTMQIPKSSGIFHISSRNLEGYSSPVSKTGRSSNRNVGESFLL